jgi:hypothetical protein
VLSLIGLQELEHFMQIGLVGRTNLPASVRTERRKAARHEVSRMADLMESEPLNVQIGLVDDSMPSSTYQIFVGAKHKILAVSPFHMGALPNVRNGIATITAAPEALKVYEGMISRLWKGAYKGKTGAAHLRQLLARL